MLILISMGILDMELDLIEEEVFHFQVVDMVKMYQFFGQIWVLLLILMLKKDLLVLGFGPTQGLEHTLTAKKMYSINSTVTKKKICLSLHYNGANSYLFVNGKEIAKFKTKDSEIVVSPLCLGNISKDWSTDNMEKTGLNGYVYELSVDYSDFSKINLDKAIPFVHKYLMIKYNMK